MRLFFFVQKTISGQSVHKPMTDPVSCMTDDCLGRQPEWSSLQANSFILKLPVNIYNYE